jgi:phage tail-like protein
VLPATRRTETDTGPSGQPILAYQVHRCWVSKYQALPDLVADERVMLVESITLEHGYRRADTWPMIRTGW